MSVTVRILGDDSDLQNKLRGSATAVAKWGAAAVAASAAATAAMVRSGLQSADAQAKLARQLNTTTDALARTQRAADLAGVSQSQLDSATRSLNQRLGQAISGSGAAADAMHRLGLDAKTVANLPLDQRIAEINKRITETVPAAERAAVAAELFGTRGGQAIAQMDPDTIARAAREVDRFGGALNDVDAAKIEDANDAMSQGGMAMEQMTQQLAVQFAPVLQGVTDLLAEMAEETGGIASIAERTFDMMIKGAGFAADAFRGFHVIIKGIEVAFRGLVAVSMTTWEEILKSFDYVANTIRNVLNDLIRGFNRLPGVNIDQLVVGESAATAKVREWADGARNAMAESVDEMHELMMRPLPSEALRDWVDNVKAASEEAAQEAVKAREAMGLPSLDGGGSGLTEAEQKAIESRLEKIRESHLSEIELLEQKFAEENELIQQALANQLITEDEHYQMMLNQKQSHEDRLTDIEDRAAEQRKRIKEQEERAKQQIMSQAWSAMTSLMNSGSRKLFEIGKAAAISQSIIATYQGMSEALKLGWPMGPVAAAAIGAGGFANVASIRSQSFGSGGGSAGSATQQISGNMQGVQQPAAGGGGQSGGTYVMRGFNENQFVRTDNVREMLEDMWRDGAGSGRLIFE